MKVTIWISGSVCRALVRNEDGYVIDTDDSFDGIGAMQESILETYPEAEVSVVREKLKIRDLDYEWNVCVRGI
jgi:hypothetical protein